MIKYNTLGKVTLFFICCVLTLTVNAQEKVIISPAYENGSITFFTNKVILNNNKTTLGICYKLPDTAQSTWNLSTDTHLTSKGKDYAMTGCTVFRRDNNGTILESETLDHEKDYTHEWDSLSIDFEPLNKDCTSFDFIETKVSNFNHYGIRLDGKKYDFLFKDKPKPLYGKNEPLPPIVPKYGKATMKYDIRGHERDKYDMMTFAIKNELTAEYFPFDYENPNQLTIEASKAYSIQTYDGCNIPSETYVVNQFKQLMIPGTETTITFDAAACLALTKSKGKAKIPFDKCVRFSGSIADLQEVMLRERDYGSIYIKENGIGADSLWNTLQENIRKINGKEYKAKKYTRRQKEFLQLWLEYNYIRKFLIHDINPTDVLVDKHASELGILFKDGRSFYLVSNDDFLNYAHANGINSEVTEWMEGYHRAMNMAKRMHNLELMPESAFDTIPECFHKDLQQLNDSTAATIERLKSEASKVEIKDIPDVNASEFLQTIVNENKGNVIFIDFWATWCGPCKLGIEAMKTRKDEFTGKSVKFIYITNESSPNNEWVRTIQSMPGIHYRLKNDMWYNIKEIGDAIPRYLMFDKSGKLIYEQTGFTDSVLEEILKNLKENI